ncbi:AraC family transcriptional regulator [Pseudomonas tohonis]|uniref:AraC family transcriptional regulator n=1 Tax=Pseudomonas tohonis TaxID=2725477 RepID=A0A6J4E513_9PSED|nr:MULTISPECIES: helix-turn-helix transcriptional regulator [Pseudomonas]BBP82534.1 AraC family transcriptional regulator [Pseudomonas sp. Pc102]BCG24074.1 AraC family transcriptional regulator [Pseudomonas tohonis]GJN56201.1 AraC family transcriptional regulator [Pseudomonas tohonis]
MSPARQAPPAVPPIPDYPRLPRPVYLRMFDIPAGHPIEMHSHDWVQFTYARAGVMQVLTEGHSYLLPPQCALWIPAGVRHTAYSERAIEFRSLYLDASVLDGYQRECAVLQVTPLLRELMERASGFPRDYPEQGAEARLLRVLVDEVRSLEEAPFSLPLPRDARLRRITDALQADPADNRGIEAWAGQVGASRRTLVRLFQAETQLSFREWRQRLRLLAALPLLADGMSVTALASELGYDSLSAFIALFQRHYGCTPGVYGSRLRG